MVDSPWPCDGRVMLKRRRRLLRFGAIALLTTAAVPFALDDAPGVAWALFISAVALTVVPRARGFFISAVALTVVPRARGRRRRPTDARFPRAGRSRKASGTARHGSRRHRAAGRHRRSDAPRRDGTAPDNTARAGADEESAASRPGPQPLAAIAVSCPNHSPEERTERAARRDTSAIRRR
jgi:hypothetical protein